jgi:hypothetical protein
MVVTEDTVGAECGRYAQRGRTKRVMNSQRQTLAGDGKTNECHKEQRRDARKRTCVGICALEGHCPALSALLHQVKQVDRRRRGVPAVRGFSSKFVRATLHVHTTNQVSPACPSRIKPPCILKLCSVKGGKKIGYVKFLSPCCRVSELFHCAGTFKSSRT